MRRTLGILAAAALFMSMPTSASAITDGFPDDTNRYPFVGLLAFRDADNDYLHRCSGTLLSPTIVLTASHCTDGTSIVHAYFSYLVPDNFRTNPTGVVGTPNTHPDYNPNTLDNDVAVVELAPPGVVLGTYPVLADEGFLSDLKLEHEIQDDTFVNVGYGLLNGSPPPNLLPNEDRWYSTAPYGGLTQNNLHLQNNNHGHRSGRDVLRRLGWSAFLGRHARARIGYELGR